MPEQKEPCARRWCSALLRFGEEFLASIFSPGTGWVTRGMVMVFFLILLVWGIRRWGIFYSWGNISLDFLDWGEVTGPRYALLRDAVEKGVLPLHALNTTALRGVTDRYFSIADTPFSPQMLLLPYLQTGEYLFFDTLLFYCLGFAGLLIVYRKYRLSPFSFLLLFLLFNFNGSITSHLAVGHSIWTGHFLLPFFILLVLHLVEHGQAGWKWILGMSSFMVLLLLQGSFHIFLWCLMYLALLPLVNWRLWKPVLLAGVFTGLLGLPRLLPPVLALSGVTQEYLGGFASLTNLVEGMIVLRDPQNAIRPVTDTFPLNFWETDFYIGLAGFGLMLVWGVVIPLFRDRSRTSVQVQLLVPSAIMAAFSIGDVFARVVSIFRIPPFTGERVTSRFLEIPMMVILFLAVIFLQRELDRRRIGSLGQFLALLAAYLLYHDLNQHLEAWRIRYLDAMVDLFPKMPFDPAQHTIQNHADTLYTGMMTGGLVVTLLALVFLLWMLVREGRAAGKESTR